MDSPRSTVPLQVSQEISRPWYLVLVGISLVLVTMVFAIPEPSRADSPGNFWIAYLVLYVLFSLHRVSGKMPEGAAVGLLLPALAAALSLGLVAALALAIMGALVAGILQILLGFDAGATTRLQRLQIVRRKALHETGAISASVIVSAALYTAIGGELPVTAFTEADINQSMTLLLIALVIHHVIDYFIVLPHIQVGAAELLYQSFNNALLDAVLTLPVIPILLFRTMTTPAVLIVIFWSLILAALYLRSLHISWDTMTTRIAELTTLNVANNALAEALNSGDLLGAIHLQTSRLIDAPLFFIALHKPEQQQISFPIVVKNGQRIEWPDRPWLNGPIESILESCKPLLSDHCKEPVFQQEHRGAQGMREACRSFLGVPVIHQDQVYGVLAVQHPTRTGAYTANELQLLETIAAQAAIIFRNAKIREEAEKHNTGLAAVNYAATLINTHLEVDAIIRQVCSTALDLSRANSVAFFMKSDLDISFKVAYTIRLNRHALDDIIDSIPDQEALWTDWLTRPQATNIPLLADDHNAEWLAPLFATENIQAMTVVPLISVRSMLEERTLSPAQDLIGFQMMFYDRPHRATEEELELLQLLANHAAIGIENALLVEETQNTVRRLAYLAETTRIFSESLELERVAAAIVDWLTDVLELDTATLALWENGTGQLRVAAHTSGHLIPHKLATPDLAQPLEDLPEVSKALEGRWTIVFQASEEALSPGLRRIFDQTRLKALAFTPLIVRDEPIGLLALGMQRAAQIPSGDLKLAEAIGGLVATAIQNAQLHELTETELTDRVMEISVLESVLRRISASVEEETIIKFVLDAALTATQADLVSCGLLHDGELTMFWATNEKPNIVRQRQFARAWRGVTGQVLERHQPIIIDDTSKVPEYWRPEGSAGYRSELCVPILHQGQILGAINLESTKLANFNQAHMRFAMSLAGHAAIALIRARLFASNKRQIDLLEKIRIFSLDLLDAQDMKTLLDQICTVALSVVDALNVHIYFYDPGTERLTFGTSAYSDGRRGIEIAKPRPHGLTHRGVRSSAPIITDDFDRIPGVETQLIGTFPLRHSGQTIGVLNIAVDDPRKMGEYEIRAIELLTNQSASAIERVRLIENRQRQIEMQERLRSISVELLNTLEIEQIAEVICRSALMLVDAEDVHLYAYNEQTDELTFSASLWRDGRKNVEYHKPRPNGVTFRTAHSGQTTMYGYDELGFNDPGVNVSALLGIPLKNSGQVVGVLNVAVTDADTLRDDEIRTLELLANQSAAAFLNARLHAEVRDGRDQMYIVLNTVRDGLALIGRGGHLLQVNPAAETLLNLSLQPYLGEHVLRILRKAGYHQFPASSPINRQNIKALWQQIEGNPYEITNRHIQIVAGGRTTYLDEESAPVLAENGEPIGRLFIWHDVTEAHHLEETRNELTNTIVHDLRSPLTAIKGGINMLREMISGGEDTEIVLEVAEIAEVSTDGLLMLVESLLDVARLESGDLPLHITAVMPHEAIEQAIQLLKMLAQEFNVRLETDLEDNLPYVLCDHDKVRRILINLIDNALHYTPPEGMVRLSVETIDHGETVLFSVEDSGPGVPPDARERIFEKFTTGITGDAPHKHRGLGLGLTFCKLAVEAHSGRIWVDESATGGAAFRFTLPVFNDNSKMQGK